MLLARILTLILAVATQSLSSTPTKEIQVSSQEPTLEESLNGVLISSEWSLLSGNISDLSLTSKQGNSSTLFSSRSIRSESSPPAIPRNVNHVTIMLHDPIYANRGMIQLDIDLTNSFNKERNLWIGKTTSRVLFFKEGVRISQNSSEVQFVIGRTESEVKLNGVSLKTSMRVFSHYDWIGIFIMLAQFSMIGVLQFASLSHLHSVSTPAILLLMISQLSWSFVYIYLSFITPPQYSIILLFSGAFAIACFLRILQKYSRVLEIKTKWEKVAGLGMVAYIYCHMLWYSSWVFNLLNCLTLVPQIVKNFRSESKKVGSSKHLISMFLVNNAFPIYLLMANNNILRLPPNRTMGLVVLTLMSIQILVLRLHSGLRKYSKYIRGKVSSKTVPQILKNCSICLCDIGEEELVSTPCEHHFHESCVTRWLRYKRTCPMDRKALCVADLC